MWQRQWSWVWVWTLFKNLNFQTMKVSTIMMVILSFVRSTRLGLGHHNVGDLRNSIFNVSIVEIIHLTMVEYCNFLRNFSPIQLLLWLEIG